MQPHINMELDLIASMFVWEELPSTCVRVWLGFSLASSITFLCSNRDI